MRFAIPPPCTYFAQHLREDRAELEAQSSCSCAVLADWRVRARTKGNQSMYSPRGLRWECCRR